MTGRPGSDADDDWAEPVQYVGGHDLAERRRNGPAVHGRQWARSSYFPIPTLASSILPNRSHPLCSAVPSSVTRSQIEELHRLSQRVKSCVAKTMTPTDSNIDSVSARAPVKDQLATSCYNPSPVFDQSYIGNSPQITKRAPEVPGPEHTKRLKTELEPDLSGFDEDNVTSLCSGHPRPVSALFKIRKSQNRRDTFKRLAVQTKPIDRERYVQETPAEARLTSDTSTAAARPLSKQLFDDLRSDPTVVLADQISVGPQNLMHRLFSDQMRSMGDVDQLLPAPDMFRADAIETGCINQDAGGVMGGYDEMACPGSPRRPTWLQDMCPSPNESSSPERSRRNRRSEADRFVDSSNRQRSYKALGALSSRLKALECRTASTRLIFMNKAKSNFSKVDNSILYWIASDVFCPRSDLHCCLSLLRKNCSPTVETVQLLIHDDDWHSSDLAVGNFIRIPGRDYGNQWSLENNDVAMVFVSFLSVESDIDDTWFKKQLQLVIGTT